MKLTKKHLNEIVDTSKKFYLENYQGDLNPDNYLAYCYLEGVLSFMKKHNLGFEDLDTSKTDFIRTTPEPIE